MKRNELKDSGYRVVESRFPVAGVETCIVYYTGWRLAYSARYEIRTFENGVNVPSLGLVGIGLEKHAKAELVRILRKVKNHYCNQA